jgi:hypothetical protein
VLLDKLQFCASFHADRIMDDTTPWK